MYLMVTHKAPLSIKKSGSQPEREKMWILVMGTGAVTWTIMGIDSSCEPRQPSSLVIGNILYGQSISQLVLWKL